MIRFKCNGEPYIDPLHKFTIEDWKAGENTESGQAITDIISKAGDTESLTLDAMMAAIEKLKEPPPEQEGNTLCGTFVVKRCPAMKGMDVIVLSGDKAYCWPEGIAGKEVKVIRIPEYKPEELKIDWNF